jgi:hypothetical protein
LDVVADVFEVLADLVRACLTGTAFERPHVAEELKSRAARLDAATAGVFDLLQVVSQRLNQDPSSTSDRGER